MAELTDNSAALLAPLIAFFTEGSISADGQREIEELVDVCRASRENLHTHA